MASGIQHSGSTLLVLLALLVLMLALFFGLLPALFSLCLPPAVPAFAARILGENLTLQSTQSLTPHTSLTPLSSVCPLFLGCNAPSLCCLLTGSALGLSAHNILQTQNHITYYLHHHLDCQLVILLRIADLPAAHCAHICIVSQFLVPQPSVCHLRHVSCRNTVCYLFPKSMLDPCTPRLYSLHFSRCRLVHKFRLRS
jgi:hypothetical protein